MRSKLVTSLSVVALSFLITPVVSAATLYFYPQNISLVPGEEALVDIRIDTGADAINAVELEGMLSGVAATLRDIDTSGSALDIFVEKPNIKGRASFRFVGGVPAGLVGEHVLARLALRGELAGSAMLAFDPKKTKALLADGTGNAAALTFINASLKVLPKTKDYLTISSDSHPDQGQWYAAETAHVHFDFDPKATYSYVISRNPLENPDEVADQPEGEARFEGGVKLEGLPEGVSYFAVKKIGTSSVSRYRLMNDISKPVWLEVEKNQGTPETEGRPFLTFLADDSVSGVEYYEMRVNGQEPIVVVSPAPLPDAYTVLSIRAYDRAGNYIEKFIPGPRKEYSIWVWAAILFVLLVWVSGIIDTDKRKK